MPFRFLTRRSLALLAVLGLLSLGITACGNSSSSSSASSSTSAPASSSSSTISNTKAKFVLHAGLAFGAFHRWIYKPARAGDLAHPFHHKFTAIKAGLAAAFVYHELGIALKDAQADATLSKLVAPITDLQNKIHGVAGSVKSGGTSAADAGSLDSVVSAIKGQASSAGTTITEQTPASPAG